MAIHIGCGSWADPEYTGLLYPPKLPPKKKLGAYSQFFDHIEINSSYYATPRKATVKQWIEQTPSDFTFNVKLHRAFSRSPAKVTAEGSLLKGYLEGVEPLREGGRFGAFLLVLPAEFAPGAHSLSELDELVEKLRPSLLAIELRHRAWVSGKQLKLTLEYFRSRGVILISVDLPRIAGSTLLPAIDEVTQPKLAYLRLHGRNPNYLNAKSAAEGHEYAYAPRELRQIAKRVRKLAENAAEVHVIANNHARDFAPKTALALRALLGLEGRSAGSQQGR